MLLHLQRTWTEMELLPLVCFCLLTCSGTTFGDEGRLVTTRMVKLNGEVVLPCSFGTTDITAEIFDWTKDDQKEVFMYYNGSHYNNGRPGQDPQFKGRVSHFKDQLQSGNASIEIRNIEKADSGRYKCIFPFPEQRTRSMIELIVGSSPEPYAGTLHQTDDQALLQCVVRGVFPKPKVQWLDSDNNTVPAEEPQVTESEGKYNIILKVTVTKSGYYRCVSTQEEICHQTTSEIHVFWSEKQPESQGSSFGWTGVIVSFVLGGIVVAVIAVVVYYRCIRGKPKADKCEEAPNEPNKTKLMPKDGDLCVSSSSAFIPTEVNKQESQQPDQ